MDMITLLRPSSAKPRMFCSVHKPAVGADHGADAALGGVPGHGPQILVHHGFPAHEQQVADVVSQGRFDHVAAPVQCDAPARLGSKRSTANLQKSHLALQMLVMANCR